MESNLTVSSVASISSNSSSIPILTAYQNSTVHPYIRMLKKAQFKPLKRSLKETAISS
jgi:hypothetical protein